MKFKIGLPFSIAKPAIFILPYILLLSSISIFGQNDDCLICHDDNTLTMERNGKSVSIFVSQKVFSTSIHGSMDCVDCHEDFDAEDLPHKEGSDIAKVECGNCHDQEAEQYSMSLHGKALATEKFLAPKCYTCHGKHNILSSANENSRTYVMNIPSLCGGCHKEGTTVSRLASVSQRHVLEDYSESIHGDGLFKRGLIVTAVCTSCHFSHNILPHEDPKSSINRSNISQTCMQCHSQIETVHKKVIKGELWEKQPHIIPACIDCHQPHKVRRVFYEQNFTDDMCMSCHNNKDLYMTVNDKRISLYIDVTQIKNSAHKDNSCIKCHTNVSTSNNPVCKGSGKVDCSICHAEPVNDYQISQHGKLYADNNPNAPYCTDCHGTHDILKKTNQNSQTFSRNIPDLCGQCHREGEKAAALYKGLEHEIVQNYSMSIHGKGLLKSGLMVTATCVDCHTNHRELPASDPLSSVNPSNIATTCAQCHLGIYEQFKESIHSKTVTNTDKNLPDCHDCHQSHTIKRVDQDNFRQGILDQCGRCHQDVAATYFDTFHGKVSKLGSVKTAKCHDCHGAHNILPTYNPKSTLSRANVVNTCKTCHPNSNRKFVGYLTHATHHDKDKYPILYYTFWGMSILLVGTFTFFGLHTLLWLPRALAEKRKTKKVLKKNNKKQEGKDGSEK